METNKYQVFAKVAELGNLTRAARELNYTQPGISHIITNFEKELGFPLVIRRKSGVILTDEGKKILESVQKILRGEQELAQHQRDIIGLKEGTIVIGTFVSANLSWLPYIIAGFLKLYPKVQFKIIHGDYDSIQYSLINDKINCGFLVESDYTDLEFTNLIDDEFFVILPPKHPLGKHKTIALTDLSQLPLIVPGEGLNFDFGKLLQQIPDANVRIHTQDDHSATLLVEQGVGITLLPKLVLENLAAQVVCKPLKPAYYRKLGIAIHSRQYASPLTIEFMDYAVSWIGKRYEE